MREMRYRSFIRRSLRCRTSGDFDGRGTFLCFFSAQTNIILEVRPPPIAVVGRQDARLSGVVAAKRFRNIDGIALVPECLVLYFQGISLQSKRSVRSTSILVFSFFCPRKDSNSLEMTLKEACLRGVPSRSCSSTAYSSKSSNKASFVVASAETTISGI